MGSPLTVKALEALGRERLSRSFYMRDFLYSEISQTHAIPNIPDDPALALAAGRRLCQELLKPLQSDFGRIAIRSAYRSAKLNEFGNKNGFACATNDKNATHHIWDKRDSEGLMGPRHGSSSLGLRTDSVSPETGNASLGGFMTTSRTVRCISFQSYGR